MDLDVVDIEPALHDIVPIGVGQTFRPHVASFHTLGFYRDIQRLLRPNGQACQFLPVGFLSELELRSAVDIFLAVFPPATHWYNQYAEFVLIGSATGTPALTMARMEVLENSPMVDAELRAAGRAGLAARFLVGSPALARLAAGAPVFGDGRPTLEYSPARHRDLVMGNLEQPTKAMDSGLAALMAPFLDSVIALRREYLERHMEQ